MDSFTYTDSSVKDNEQYEKWNLFIKTLSLTEYEVMVNGIKDNRNYGVNISINGLNEEEVISTVSDWVVNNIDENFEIVLQKSYKYFDDDDGKIYQVVITELRNINDVTFYVDELRLDME